MKSYLYALTLPEALSLAITSYKRSLFKSQTIVSALAVPPLVPVVWTGEPHPIPQNIISPSNWIADPEKLILYEGFWFIPCDSHGEFSQIGAAFDQYDSLRGLFGPCSGIALASASEAGKLPVPELPVHIKDFRLGLYEFTCKERERWYEDLFIRLIEQRHLR